MLFKTSPEKFWNLIASKYAASPIQDRQAYETKIQKIKTYLAPDNVVLDIGCGTGTQCGDIAERVKQVTGIDISYKLLAIAKQRMAERDLDNVEFLLQTRLGYLSFLLLALPEGLQWLLWVPAVGTLLRVLTGYCIMARMLMLMPFNREVQLSAEFVTAAFLTPPVAGNILHGLPARK